MMKKSGNRIISLILALSILIISLPVSMMLSADEFVPVNLFQTEHLVEKTGAIYYSWANGEVVNQETGTFYSDTRFNGAGALTASIDGDLDTFKDVWAYDYEEGKTANLVGARYHLDDSYYVGNFVIYAGSASKDDYFRVYASENLDDLYTNSSNIVTTNTVCNGEAVTIPINRKIKYISIFYDANATIAGCPEVADPNTIKDTRVAEFQLWTGEEPVEFVAENLFQTEHLVEKTGAIYYSWANGEVVNQETGTYYTDTRFNGAGALTASVDGDLSTFKDVWAFDYEEGKVANLVGARYHLDDSYYVGNLVIYAGSEAKDDYFQIYASENLDDLYSNSLNIVSTNTVCNGTAVTVPINRKIKYISIFYDANATIAACPEVADPNTIKDTRVAEFQLWTADENQVPEGFVSQNILPTCIESTSEVLFNISTNAVVLQNKFNENGALATVIDGDIGTHTDVYGWDADNLVGVRYSLQEAVYCGKAVIYSGFDAYPDRLTVYASEKLDDLFNTESRVAYNKTSTGSPLEIELNKKVQYIAFFINSDMARVKEFELWTAEPPAEFVPENLFETEHLVEKNSAIFYSWANGEVKNEETGEFYTDTRFNGAGALTASVDGDVATFKDVWAYDYEEGKTSNLVGARYHLDDAHFVGDLVIYAGDTSKDAYFRVYAAENLDDLYDSTANRFSSTNVICKGTAVTVPINRKVKYISIFYDSNATIAAYPSVVSDPNTIKDTRVAEFQLWTGDESNSDNIEPAPAKKILTIGNSFAENASIYATEIAGAQGFDLTFGYLKYPSCTIAQHYDNAVNDTAVYKFAVTEKGNPVNKTTVKDGSSTFATVKEALEYTNWDYIAIQQGSTASYNYDTYEKADELIAYIKGICPDAQIMLHETWSWKGWAKDEIPENNFKFIEDCYHKLAEDNGNLRIIPSGRAFEFARREGIDVNDSDGQHANDYGQYLAGACYVSIIFGADINENPFGDGHPAFSDVDMNTLRSAVMSAVNFRYNPETNWDWADGLDEEEEGPDPNAPNFIKRHFGSAVDIMQDVASGGFSEGVRFSSANADALKIAIDGDFDKHFDVYGALDWEYPKNIGAMYKLDASYIIDEILISAGLEGYISEVDVYASDSVGALYSEASCVAKGVKCSGEKITIPLGKQISCIAFVISNYDTSNCAHFKEIDLVGSEEPIIKEEIIWPEPPASANILKGAAASKIIAPGGDYKGTKEFEYRLMLQQTEKDLSVLTDGMFDIHYDVWNTSETDRPGVLYDLGAYYDLSHLHAWAGAEGSELILINGYKIYASETLADLYDVKNLVLDYTNKDDTTNHVGVNVDLKRIRYVAFLVTNSSDGGWRMREFAAYGTKSADQTQKAEPTSIIEGIEAEYYGVATDNLADPIYMGASDYVQALTDGTRNHIEFWGGSDTENTCFVFIYNLYANYDLTSVDIYAFADNIEEDTGIHKGIRSAKVYASRTFDKLFTSQPVVMKTDYADPKVADENAYYTAAAPSDWKNVRYIAYVFTIGDSRYGACRLEELKAFGKLSAVQDPEPEEVKLPQYIDVKAENGVIARIFALNANDDLSKLGAHLNSERSAKDKDIKFINNSLKGYSADAVYSVQIVTEDGTVIDTDGRFIRLSIPKEKDNHYVACVDDFGAEIVSNGMLNDYLTVETSTLRSYALVNKTGEADTSDTANADGGLDLLWIVVIALGALAACGVGLSVLFGVKSRKS